MLGNSSSAFSVQFLQLDYRPGESADQRIERVLDDTRGAPPADLLVLPELWDVGYFCFDEYEIRATTLKEGPVTKLAGIARRRGCTIVGGSVIERRGTALHNSVPVLGPDGQILGLYRKIHLLGYASLEKKLLTPGDDVTVVETSVGRIGVSTCFDLRFPQQFSEMRRLGADLVVVPAAWPKARHEHWDVLVKARAIETQTPLVACNGTGTVRDVELAGSSVVVDATGRVLASAGNDPGWHGATIDPSSTLEWRREFPLEEMAVG